MRICMNYLIGIDLGTSSTKTVLFDENGEVIASAGKDYPLYTPHNGGLSPSGCLALLFSEC